MQNPLFCVHTLCMSYVTNTFLLVSSSVRSKRLLCSLHGQGQKNEQKPRTKTFFRFHNHSPLLTMMLWTLKSPKKDEKHVHCDDSALSVLAMFGVSKRFSRSICYVVCLSL